MYKFLEVLSLKSDAVGGLAISRTKIVTLVAALFNVLQEFGIFHATTSQQLSVNGLLVAIALLFMREGMNGGAKP